MRSEEETMRTTEDRLGGAVSSARWPLFFRGLAAVLFGVLTFIVPGLSLLALIYLFGAYALVDGVLNIVAATRRRGEGTWWALLLEGIAGIVAGVLAFFLPAVTAIALVFLIAGWALVTGGLEIAAAIRLRKVIDGEWRLALRGVLSVALGVLLALFPGPGALALVVWIGAFAIAFGVVLMVLSLRIRSWRDEGMIHRAPAPAR
jgi:uncharacterized membrane protein HdeD (DUF308 family)